MNHQLDANIIVQLTLGHDKVVRARASACAEGEMVTSAVALAEVAYGSVNRKPPPIERLTAFVQEVPVLPFDSKATLASATFPFKRASFDRLIAAHAPSHDLIVATDHPDDFAAAAGLRVEHRTQPA